MLLCFCMRNAYQVALVFLWGQVIIYRLGEGVGGFLVKDSKIYVIPPLNVIL